MLLTDVYSIKLCATVGTTYHHSIFSLMQNQKKNAWFRLVYFALFRLFCVYFTYLQVFFYVADWWNGAVDPQFQQRGGGADEEDVAKDRHTSETRIGTQRTSDGGRRTNLLPTRNQQNDYGDDEEVQQGKSNHHQHLSMLSQGTELWTFISGIIWMISRRTMFDTLICRHHKLTVIKSSQQFPLINQLFILFPPGCQRQPAHRLGAVSTWEVPLRCQVGTWRLHGTGTRQSATTRLRRPCATRLWKH